MANGATIGQAYVQILPSMDGLSKTINGAAEPASRTAGTFSGKSLGKALVGTVGKVLAGAGIGKTIMTAFTEGGKLQQSIGGIETLFKDSAGIVEKNAKNAFKTAGMSANEYMENTTSFAASLISSVNGNTKEAANLADMAMRDMSDNANKMGTDLASITGTYQSLARGNYAMLDNLKLGYGGTKSEMERLIKDASGMKDEMNELGISVDGTDMSFANMVKAISVVQKHLDITGTTTKEAATTLSGSFGMLKSSLTDLLGNLTLGEDVVGPLKNTFSALGTFVVGNVIPMVGNLFSGIGTVIATTDWSSVASTALGKLTEALSKGTTILADVGGKIGEYLTDIDFNQVGTNIWNGFTKIIMSINWAGLGVALIKLFAGGCNLAIGTLLGVFSGIKQTINNVLSAIKSKINIDFSGIKNVASTMMANMKQSFSEGWTRISNSFKTAIDGIKQKFKVFTDILSNIKQKFEDFKSKLSSPFNLLSGLKIPKISISGGSVPFGIGGLGEKPSISVKWNAEGGIFDSASIIGYGVGERGKEAILPLDRFWNELEQSQNNNYMIGLYDYFVRGQFKRDVSDVINNADLNIDKRRMGRWIIEEVLA